MRPRLYQYEPIDQTIYEFLPTIYIIIGLVLGAVIDNWGQYFADLFVIAGVIVFNWRIRSRT